MSMSKENAERVMNGEITAIHEWYRSWRAKGRSNYKKWAAEANEVCRLVLEGRQRYWPEKRREWFSPAEAVEKVQKMNWSCGHGPANWISEPNYQRCVDYPWLECTYVIEGCSPCDGIQPGSSGCAYLGHRVEAGVSAEDTCCEDGHRARHRDGGPREKGEKHENRVFLVR